MTEIKVTCKQAPGFYVRAATTFLEGVPAKDGKEARMAVKEITITGLGNAIAAVAQVAGRLESAGTATIEKVETAYPKMEGRVENAVAQLRVTMKACPKVPLFVINGFYMSMREKYTLPSANLYWLTVEFDPEKLSWEDFRGKVLGATDPAESAKGSLRKHIYENWKSLGLEFQPNVGENGMHGSASPFEAMAERLNWLKTKLEDDAFAKAMLDAGIKKADLEAWTKDPQVPVDGKNASLFDSVEDTNSTECLAKLAKIGGSSKTPGAYKKNEAFLFIKPHAVTDATKAYVKKALAEKGIKIVKEGTLNGTTIGNDKLIDNHYYAIANKASLTKPVDLNVPDKGKDEFKKTFGLTWEDALQQRKVYNAIDGCQKLGMSGDEMESQWAITKKAKKLVKFGGGFYAGLVEPLPKVPVFVINGFYMSMREKYTLPSANLYWLTVEFDPEKLSWEDFRGKVLGATDPAESAKGSLRKQIYENWKSLGLGFQPNVGENGMHGSASPFEAMAERLNWLKTDLKQDAFAKAMLDAGIKKADLEAWTKDPQVPVDGKNASLFDSVEDTNSTECLAKLAKIGGSSKTPGAYKKNEAFLFIKPHAVTDATKALVKKVLEEKGVKILKEGTLNGAVIGKDKLIDNHYYAIANKASLTKPVDLNVPDKGKAEFKSTFGLSWEDALKQNKVFNAMDGCAKLEMSGDQMESQWAITKKAKKLVKFGGGFYAGLVEPLKD